MNVVISVKHDDKTIYIQHPEHFKGLSVFSGDITIPLELTKRGFKYLKKYVKSNYPIYDTPQVEMFIQTTEPDVSALTMKDMYYLSKLASFLNNANFTDVINVAFEKLIKDNDVVELYNYC